MIPDIVLSFHFQTQVGHAFPVLHFHSGNALQIPGSRLNRFCRTADIHIDIALAFIELGQVFDGIAGYDLSPGNDDDIITHSTDFGQNVAGKNYSMILPQFPDQIPDFDNLQRVQTYGRLVQNDNFRVSQNGLRDAYTLLIPFGQILDQPGTHGGQRGFGNHPVHTVIQRFPFHPFGLSHKIQVFLRRHIHIQRRQFRQISDAGFGFHRVFINIVTVDGDFSLRGGQTSCDDVHSGGFSGAVGPQKPIDPSFFHGKAHVSDSFKIAVPLYQMFNFDQGNDPSLRQNFVTHTPDRRYYTTIW